MRLKIGVLLLLFVLSVVLYVTWSPFLNVINFLCSMGVILGTLSFIFIGKDLLDYVHDTLIESTIYIDEKGKLLTAKEKVNKIFGGLLRQSEKFNRLRIKIKSKKNISKTDSVISTFAWAMQENLSNEREKRLKRGLSLLLSPKFFKAVANIKLSETDIDEIIPDFFYRASSEHAWYNAVKAEDVKAERVLEVFIEGLEKTVNLNLTEEDYSILKKDKNESDKIPAELKDVKDFNNTSVYDNNVAKIIDKYQLQILLDFIITYSKSEEVWKDNQFVIQEDKKKDIDKIFYRMYWNAR